MAVCLPCAAAFAKVEIAGPDGGVIVSISPDASGHLSWSMTFNGAEVVAKSRMGIAIGGVDLGKGATPGEAKVAAVDETFPTRGKHAVGADRRNRAEIPVAGPDGAQAMILEVSVFNDGAAFRYRLPGSAGKMVSGEATAWRLPADAMTWHNENTKNYEGDYLRKDAGKIAAGTDIVTPFLAELPGHAGYLAIAEAALFNYSGMTLKAEGDALFRAAFLDDPDGWTPAGDIVSPWRATMVSKDLNGLFNSDIIEALNEPPSPELANADWIRPGRSLWSWLNGGQEGVNPENMRHYSDAAGELGFEFLLVDDGWEDNPRIWKERKGWSAPGKTNFDLMADLVKYAKEKNVGIWVWKHFFLIQEEGPRREFFKKLHDIGVVGVKVDFMDSESLEQVDFYESCLKDAADFQLMVDFHGANKPTGESRRYPNEMTREGVKGLEYRVVFADHNATLPFTRMLAGHLDYTPMHFQRLWMGNTSVTHQLASGIIFTSPVTFFGGHPDDYANSPANKVIEAIASAWDETIVLEESRIGKMAAFARRSGDDWFVAIMNGGGAARFKLPVDFLDKSAAYEATVVYDEKADPMLMGVHEMDVDLSKAFPVKMRSGGGFVAWIRKK